MEVGQNELHPKLRFRFYRRPNGRIAEKRPMKDMEYYRGREQTYLKHFFLERYLERVAYIIGFSRPKFAYVDGFSGPWMSADEEFEDTSFRIALKKLRQVRNGLALHRRHPNVRCLFIEKDTAAYEALKSTVNDGSGLTVKALHGEFEDLMPEILNFIGNSFSLVFIDPTGWKGFGLRKIEPLLRRTSGEVIVNFMFDHINRFLDDPRSEIVASFEELFGGSAPDTAMLSGPQREKKIIEFYCGQMRNLGQFEYVTSTRVLKPVSDRSYFYLVYGTRHLTARGKSRDSSDYRSFRNLTWKWFIDASGEPNTSNRAGSTPRSASSRSNGPFSPQKAQNDAPGPGPADSGASPPPSGGASAVPG